MGPHDRLHKRSNRLQIPESLLVEGIVLDMSIVKNALVGSLRHCTFLVLAVYRCVRLMNALQNLLYSMRFPIPLVSGILLANTVSTDRERKPGEALNAQSSLS
jgi:hypothetical protein